MALRSAKTVPQLDKSAPIVELEFEKDVLAARSGNSRAKSEHSALLGQVLLNERRLLAMRRFPVLPEWLRRTLLALGLFVVVAAVARYASRKFGWRL